MEENLEAAMANYNDDSLRTIEGLKHIRFRQGLWPMSPPRLACNGCRIGDSGCSSGPTSFPRQPRPSLRPGTSPERGNSAYSR